MSCGKKRRLQWDLELLRKKKCNAELVHYTNLEPGLQLKFEAEEIPFDDFLLEYLKHDAQKCIEYLAILYLDFY